MKIFISHPMSNKTDEEVYKIREKAIKKVSELKNISCLDITVLDNYHHCIDIPDFDQYSDDQKRVYFLARSIQLMSCKDLDLIVFSDDYLSAKGCLVEHLICELYNLPYIEL